MKSSSPDPTVGCATCTEQVEIAGHIIDSLILPKVLDLITSAGGAFRVRDIAVGDRRQDPSYALIEVQAANQFTLNEILDQIADHGAVPVHQQDCRLLPCDQPGVFPESFYSTTNQRTEVRFRGTWLPVGQQEMDCALVIDPLTSAARCVPMSEIREGEQVVVGHAGVRVFPEARDPRPALFGFMGSTVSTEKPKAVAIREVAAELFRARRERGRVLLVGGPAIIHTGSGEHLCRLIRTGYVQHLFAGNALATHDVEQAMFGTSLGIHLDGGHAADAGHEHHLRAINRIRGAGGLRQAVAQGVLTSGVMYECVRADVDYVLAGSIRDDGPLPDVITDVIEAQRQMRARIGGVTFCLMIASTLHSIAVGNLLPASVKVVAVDINPSTLIKLSDRGSFQTMGLVTDVEPFFRELLHDLDRLEQEGA